MELIHLAECNVKSEQSKFKSPAMTISNLWTGADPGFCNWRAGLLQPGGGGARCMLKHHHNYFYVCAETHSRICKL